MAINNISFETKIENVSAMLQLTKKILVGHWLTRIFC